MIKGWKVALKMLEEGATIEYTQWGIEYPVYIRLGDRFERLHLNSWYAVQKKCELEYKYSNLSVVVKLK